MDKCIVRVNVGILNISNCHISLSDVRYMATTNQISRFFVKTLLNKNPIPKSTKQKNTNDKCLDTRY